MNQLRTEPSPKVMSLLMRSRAGWRIYEQVHKGVQSHVDKLLNNGLYAFLDAKYAVIDEMYDYFMEGL